MKEDKALTKFIPCQHSSEPSCQIHICTVPNLWAEISIFAIRHALVLFGGVQGLEYSLECDETLKADNVADLCDLYLNLCPGQGSRTIRTEVRNHCLNCNNPTA